jgi:hypothetical protein
MCAIVTRDEWTFGKYLRRPGNIFEERQSQAMTVGLLRGLQNADAIRHGVNIQTITDIMDDLVSNSRKIPSPSYDELLETIAEMFDRMLTPEGVETSKQEKTCFDSSQMT